MARLKNWVVSPEMLNVILWERSDYKSVVVTGGPPKGSKIRHAGFDFARGCFVLTVEHESFPDIPEGGHILFMEPPTYQIRTGFPAVADTPVTVGG